MMNACATLEACSEYPYESGATVCDDGYYSDAGNSLGYVNTCDRPQLSKCSDGTFITDTGVCPSPPVCNDEATCLVYAQAESQCDLPDYEFNYTSPGDWEFICGASPDPEDNPIFCYPGECPSNNPPDTGGGDTGGGDTGGGDTGGGDTGGGDTGGGDTGGGDTGGGDTGGGDTGGGDTGGGDTGGGDTGGGDTGGGDTGGGDTGGGGTGGGGTGIGGTVTVSGDVSMTFKGPCDPSQPNYYQCQNMPMGNLPAHSNPGASTIEQANYNFKARIDGSALVQAFTGVAHLVNVEGGTCPVFSIDFPSPINTTASTDVHCNLMASISPILSAVMIIIYVWIAFRIFASA